MNQKKTFPSDTCCETAIQQKLGVWLSFFLSLWSIYQCINISANNCLVIFKAIKYSFFSCLVFGFWFVFGRPCTFNRRLSYVKKAEENSAWVPSCFFHVAIIPTEDLIYCATVKVIFVPLFLSRVLSCFCDFFACFCVCARVFFFAF